MTKAELIDAIKELPDDVEVTVVHSDGEVSDVFEVIIDREGINPIQLVIED